MDKKYGGIRWSGAVIALILIGLLFGVTAFAETDRNVAVLAVGTSNGVEFRVQDQGIESFRVSILTPNGKPLFKSGSVNSNSLTWNLTGSSGNRVPFGVYLYQFVGKSSAGEIAVKGVGKIFVGPKQVAAESVGSSSLSTMAQGKGKGKFNRCTTIQSGEIYTEGGDLITTGYDEYGYNYQAHMFNGRYCDFDREKGGEYCDTNLIMKWNDAWLSNKDCDGDDKLDRHYGYENYIGSGAWLTNHMRGGQGKDKWTYFTKIVAVPGDAYSEDEIWYTADGTEIGPVIWGAFAQVQTVESGEGATYVSPAGAGLGKWKE